MSDPTGGWNDNNDNNNKGITEYYYSIIIIKGEFGGVSVTLRLLQTASEFPLDA